MSTQLHLLNRDRVPNTACRRSRWWRENLASTTALTKKSRRIYSTKVYDIVLPHREQALHDCDPHVCTPFTGRQGRARNLCFRFSPVLHFVRTGTPGSSRGIAHSRPRPALLGSVGAQETLAVFSVLPSTHSLILSCVDATAASDAEPIFSVTATGPHCEAELRLQPAMSTCESCSRPVIAKEVWMNSVRTILVASDGSRHARHAEMRAKMLGAELSTELVEVLSISDEKLTHDVQPPSSLETASIDEDAVALCGTRAVEGTPLRSGSPQIRYLHYPDTGPATIARRADEIDAGLTIVAARREGVLASIAARFRNDELIRLNDRPVLLVEREPVAAYRKVLVAVDFSAESQQAARVALAMAPGAVFTFLHVFRAAQEEMMMAHGISDDTIHSYRLHAREAARMRLNSFIEALGPRKQMISRAIQHGAHASTIHARATEMNADLIAVGKHGKSRFIELFLGSVTERLIDYGGCDLLVATSPYEETTPLPPAA